MMTFHIRPEGLYDLQASTRFLEGFAPAAYAGSTDANVRLAFPSDQSFRPVAVSIRQEGERVRVDMNGDASKEIVERQVARILSLDHDGNGYSDVIVADPVLRAITKRVGMLRPVLFHSPYEAAAWAIIGNRVRIVQAAKTKVEMAKYLGTAIGIDGETVHAFPAPDVLADLESFPGLSGRKVEYLRSLGEAAGTGHLDADRLRAMSPDDALIHLKQLKGIGDFGAELILLRAVGIVDRVPVTEGRFPRAVATAYGREELSEGELHDITDGWAPFRTWISVLMRSNLEAVTHEIGGSTVRS